MKGTVTESPRFEGPEVNDGHVFLLAGLTLIQAVFAC